MDIGAMLGPMLPKILADAGPALTQAYREKVDQLLESSGIELLINDREFKEEIVPFGTLREGKLVVQWVLLEHEYDHDEKKWCITVAQVLETVTLDQLFQSATKQLAKPKELPEVTQADEFGYEVNTSENQPPQEGEPLNMIERSGVKHVSEVMKEAHDTYFLQRFVVVKIEDSYQVIEGPAPERVTVHYGHHDQDICQNWADDANRKLNGQ